MNGSNIGSNMEGWSRGDEVLLLVLDRTESELWRECVKICPAASDGLLFGAGALVGVVDSSIAFELET